MTLPAPKAVNRHVAVYVILLLLLLYVYVVIRHLLLVAVIFYQYGPVPSPVFFRHAGFAFRSGPYSKGFSVRAQTLSPKRRRCASRRRTHSSSTLTPADHHAIAGLKITAFTLVSPMLSRTYLPAAVQNVVHKIYTYL